MRLNQESYPDGESPGKLETPDINRRGWPFTVPFERYLDGHEDIAPIVRAFNDISSDPAMRERGQRRLEYEIGWAIVFGGHTDQDTLYAVLGRPTGFQQALESVLTLLHAKTVRYVDKRVAETSQRRETAGAAQQAREDDKPKTDTRRRVRKVLV